LTETAVCPACGQSNDVAQRFCGQCGSALARVCATCSTENPPGFRFCGGCGTALDPGTPAAASPPGGDNVGASDGERRWVTVVFADLSGFTALSEHADPEDVRAMVDRCMSEMGEVVARFGGSVDKVMGDALMAVFGAPLAHEDDAERAVRAALEIQRRASAQVDDFGGLRVSIGVNTGEVIFARVGPDSRREMTVMGDVVNTASRLQGAAAPGAILVGEETHAASARAISYDPVQPISAKGKERPLPVWLARAATSSYRDPRELAGASRSPATPRGRARPRARRPRAASRPRTSSFCPPAPGSS